MTDTLDPTDADRLELLDRIEQRVPELELDAHETEWMTVHDGAEALLVDGGGIDGGPGAFFANGPNGDVHVVGCVGPGTVGCIVIRPDGTRVLARVEPDPLAEQNSD